MVHFGTSSPPFPADAHSEAFAAARGIRVGCGGLRARLRCTIRDVNWRIAGRGRVGMRGKLGELAMDATRSWGGAGGDGRRAGRGRAGSDGLGGVWDGRDGENGDVNWRIAGRGRVGMRGKLGELAMAATRSCGAGRRRVQSEPGVRSALPRTNQP